MTERHQDSRSLGATLGQTMADQIVLGAEAGIERAKHRLLRHARLLRRRTLIRGIGHFLGALALIWLGVGGTILLAVDLPLWGACLITSGAFALGSIVLLTLRFERASTTETDLNQRK